MARASLHEQIGGKCKHFNGIQHKCCEAGIDYPNGRLPCFVENQETPCGARAWRTEDEVNAEVESIENSIAEQLEMLKNGVCPTCGGSAEPRRQAGKCVYGACGHRLYQGTIPGESRPKRKPGKPGRKG